MTGGTYDNDVLENMNMSDAILAKLPLVQGAKGIADILDFRASSHGPKEALVCEGERITYSRLAIRAKAVAHHLQTMGVEPGDKVAVYLPNSVDLVAAFFGVIGADAVLVPINPLLKPEEIAHILSDSRARVLVAYEDLLPFALEAIGSAKSIDRLLLVPRTAGGASAATVPASIKVVELARTRAPQSLEWPRKLKTDQLPAVIVYTSGTTGKPKGAVLTHHNLLSVFPARLDLFDIDEHDRCLCTLPLCHIYGLTVVLIGTIARAGTLIIMPRFDARSALKLIESERVTLMPAVPAMYQMMLREMTQANFDLSSLRLLFSGAAPLPAELGRDIEARFGVPALEGYGLTETACVATINPLHGVRKPGSVGPALPGLSIEIFAADGSVLPPGPENVGEIGVCGPNVMQGYYRQPEATQEVMRGDWFMTGDLGYKDEDGYLFIAGRKKELILRGGANVYPREVEEAIMRLPGVREVAVIGVPDEIMGERVKAVLAVSDPAITADAVREHCQKLLADYKVPRIIEFVTALPRNSTGKILKRLL